jgi:hypothetical protein
LIGQAVRVSNVTSVLVLALGEYVAMRPFTLLDDDSEREWCGAFTSLTDGGADDRWVKDGKSAECDVWAGAFNHLNRPALLRDLAALPWEHPNQVQVLINGQDDDCWGLWMITDGRLQEVPLPGAVRVPLQVSARDGAGRSIRDSADDFVMFEVGILRRP